MNMQIQNTNNMKFGRKQDFLSELGKVWGKVDEIEKKAQKIWGEDNPILENIGFAWVHIMNAHIEMEKNLAQGSGNKLEPKTLAQIIDVLTRIKWTGTKYRHGLVNAYQSAVYEVGKFNGIHRNTIADACTRRLDLDRDGFLDLVESWLGGDSKSLKLTLKAHCDISLHHLIDEFFQKKGNFRENF